MVAGRKLRNLLGWPALHLDADKNRCIDCKKCTKECPMGLEVNSMVRQDRLENPDCILCGSCVDACPKGAIKYGLSGK
jgi:ferredoxin-type protein NapH